MARAANGYMLGFGLQAADDKTPEDPFAALMASRPS
jgi:hypothetical protein